MARTTSVSIPPGLEKDFRNGLQPGDRFIIPRIRKKNSAFSRGKKASIKARSYLDQIKNLWQGFSDATKQDWKDVDQHEYPNGWRAFVEDQTERIRLGLGGTATPNEYHQAMVGQLKIENPATEIKLEQSHPYEYWVHQRVVGRKRMYEPVEITEVLSLPLKIALSYKADLSASGGSPSAKFFAEVLHFYQGRNIVHNLEIDLDLSSAWKREEITISSLLGEAISYNLFLHLEDVQGELLFDNVLVEHTSQNWARDKFCDSIEREFKRGFNLILRSWDPITLPAGSSFKSIYPT